MPQSYSEQTLRIVGSSLINRIPGELRSPLISILDALNVKDYEHVREIGQQTKRIVKQAIADIEALGNIHELFSTKVDVQSEQFKKLLVSTAQLVEKYGNNNQSVINDIEALTNRISLGDTSENRSVRRFLENINRYFEALYTYKEYFINGTFEQDND